MRWSSPRGGDNASRDGNCAAGPYPRRANDDETRTRGSLHLRARKDHHAHAHGHAQTDAAVGAGTNGGRRATLALNMVSSHGRATPLL